MLSLVVHPAFRIRCRYHLFRCSAVPVTVVILVLFFHWRFPQLHPLLVDLFAKPLGIHTGSLCHLFLLVFLFVGACFDMRPVYEYHAAVHHVVVQRFVQDMFEDFRRQFFRKPPAKRIAYRRKVRELVQQPISQKPSVRYCITCPLICLPQRRDPEQVLEQHHFHQYHRVCPRPYIFGCAVVWRYPLIDPLVVHHLLYFPYQMILRH